MLTNHQNHRFQREQFLSSSSHRERTYLLLLILFINQLLSDYFLSRQGPLINWIFNNVKNNCSNAINYQVVEQSGEEARQPKRAVLILAPHQLLDSKESDSSCKSEGSIHNSAQKRSKSNVMDRSSESNGKQTLFRLVLQNKTASNTSTPRGLPRRKVSRMSRQSTFKQMRMGRPSINNSIIGNVIYVVQVQANNTNIGSIHDLNLDKNFLSSQEKKSSPRKPSQFSKTRTQVERKMQEASLIGRVNHSLEKGWSQCNSNTYREQFPESPVKPRRTKFSTNNLIWYNDLDEVKESIIDQSSDQADLLVSSRNKKKEQKKKKKEENKYVTVVDEDQELWQSDKAHTPKLPAKKQSKWKKIKNLFGTLSRFRKQEAFVLNHPDQILEEIRKTEKSFSRDVSHMEEEKKAAPKVSQFNPTNGLGRVARRSELSETEQQVMKEQGYAQNNKKVRDIDYYRKTKRMFEIVERGSRKDCKRLVYELKYDLKGQMFERSDPSHVINFKNLFGQTPLYVAAKNGNLEIVSLLISERANPHIMSQVELGLEESALQVAARWKHAEIVQYLLNSVEWSERELKDVLRMGDVPGNVKVLVRTHFRAKYGAVCCCLWM